MEECYDERNVNHDGVIRSLALTKLKQINLSGTQREHKGMEDLYGDFF